MARNLADPMLPGPKVSLKVWRSMLKPMLHRGIDQIAIDGLLDAVELPEWLRPRPTTVARRRTHDPYEAKVLPAEQNVDRTAVSGGTDAVAGLPNPAGENVCFINALAQAIGRPDRRDRVLRLCRDAGLNARAEKTQPRKQEDPAEVLAFFAKDLGLQEDMCVSTTTTCTRCKTSEQFEVAAFVYGPPAGKCTAPAEDYKCPACDARLNSGERTQQVLSCGNTAIFAINRAMREEVSSKAFKCPALITIAGDKMALAGVVLWFGMSKESGHYIAYRKENGQWMKFNDEAVCLQDPDSDHIQSRGVIAFPDISMFHNPYQYAPARTAWQV